MKKRIKKVNKKKWHFCYDTDGIYRSRGYLSYLFNLIPSFEFHYHRSTDSVVGVVITVKAFFWAFYFMADKY